MDPHTVARTSPTSEELVDAVGSGVDGVAMDRSVGDELVEPLHTQRESDGAATPPQFAPEANLTQTFLPLSTMSEVVEFALLVRDARGVSHLQLGVTTGGGAAQLSYEIELRSLGEGRLAIKMRGVGTNAREALNARRELVRRLRERGLEVVEDEDAS